MKRINQLWLTSILVACLWGCSDNNDNDPYSLIVDVDEIVFEHEVLTSSEEEQRIRAQFEGEGLVLGFAPDSVPVAWLSFYTDRVTDTSARITVSLANEDQIAPGTYETTLRLSTGNAEQGQLISQDIKVTLNIWQLQSTLSSAYIEHIEGEEPPEQIDFSVYSDNTDWTLTSPVDWLTIEQTESEEEGFTDISLNLNTDNLPPEGLKEIQLELTEARTETAKTIDITFAYQENSLIFSPAKLSFFSSGNLTHIAQNIALHTNSGEMPNWSVSSENNWLQLFADPANNTIQVKVDDSVLAEGSHFGSVVIQDTENDETFSIPVSFEKQASTVETQLIADVKADAPLLIDPFAPIAYTFGDNVLSGYHLITTEVVKSLTFEENPLSIISYVEAPNGEFALINALESITDEGGDVSEQQVYFKLTFEPLSYTKFTLPENLISYDPSLFLTWGDKQYVLSRALEFADDALEALGFISTQPFVTSQLRKVPNEPAFVAFNSATNTLHKFSININEYSTFPLKIRKTQTYQDDQLAGLFEFAFNSDGSQLYFSGANAEWLAHLDQVFGTSGRLSANENDITVKVAYDGNGNNYFYRFNPDDGFHFARYDSNQALLVKESLPFGFSQTELLPQWQLIVSYHGDSNTLIVLPMPQIAD
ncbi:hypothetical protein [Thalassotalea agarivorans]|uniref:BACON domain-containing protein n=1 Tax=Thalassotalea agarivorans TaxID=349064 RepID=A0A1H9Z910_THASX|nr:hypothetical protein [Thalassotalea agarivorans]SES77950.1 hypothetical protein SAMN05660429_00364 [Thalassotalea agarivorans]